MTQDTIKKIHRWYGCIMAVIVAGLGLLFILSCLDIYSSGPRPYSADAIALRFQRILIPVIIAFIGIAGGIVLNLLLPLDRKRRKATVHSSDIMLRLRNKADIPPVRKEIRLRILYRVVTAICFSVLMIYPLIYFLTPEHFSITELNADIIRSVIVAFIPASVGLLLCWICRHLVNKSFERETSIYKKAIASGQIKHASSEPVRTASRVSSVATVRVLLLLAGIIFVTVGIMNGGAADVLKKAIAICTECIGLG